MPKSMESTTMLSQMCQDLSNTDINAIRKARGFTTKETATRAVFETYFLSSIGVQAALDALSVEETALLHWLHYLGKPVGIDFFGRVYGDAASEQKYYYGTPTQRYRETFEKVQKNLVRRGLLLVVEQPEPATASKMERWRFGFPPEFVQYLPRLILHPYVSENSGEYRISVLRGKLQEIFGRTYPSPLKDKLPYTLQVENGRLSCGAEPFQVKQLQKWQQACWEVAAGLHKFERESEVSPLQAVNFLFEQLQPDEWMLPEQLEIPLKVFGAGQWQAAPEQVCEKGWQWGCLARCQEGDKNRYRLAPATDAAGAPAGYLQVTEGEAGIRIDLLAVPLPELELLAGLARFSCTQQQLVAAPDLVLIGRASPETRAHPVVQWLRANSEAFNNAIATIEQRWGRLVVHAGLLIARVKDLSLKIQLERALPADGNLVSLSQEYIAFAPGLLPEVEKVVKKAGYVIKRVEAKK